MVMQSIFEMNVRSHQERHIGVITNTVQMHVMTYGIVHICYMHNISVAILKLALTE